MKSQNTSTREPTATAQRDGASGPEDYPVRVIRSAKRKKSIAARFVSGTLEVRIPAWMSATEEAAAVAEMTERVAKKKGRAHSSDEELANRAAELNKKFLAGQGTIGSIRWVSNQNTRWGSTTPSTGDIRISSRLKDVPGYVLDAVIIHEVTHTFVPGHGPDFWEWADKAPHAERAKGYLEALQRFGP
ncbi:MAG: YgjP-like metallopeptidase domain-containing protein [Corynebacterium sp.]|nr:YgjP-like metallopeptidase domain-containing protein [Corynebacterium sp.]